MIRKLRRCFLCASLLLSLSVGLTGCDTGEPQAKPRRSAPKAHLVEVVSVQPREVSAQHQRPGSLRLRRLTRVFSQEEGRITELRLFEGDQVREGQLLLALEDDLLRAELDKTQATLAQKRTDVERLERLRKRRAASEDELAQARTELAVAQAEVRMLKTRLAFTRISAPFAGIITERLVEPGDFVSKNTHLLTLADPQSLVAEVLVSELVLPHIAVGDPARVRIDALGAEHFAGRILRIHPTLSRRNRQAAVEIALEPIPEGARAGQFVRAELTSAPVSRLLVPFRALRQDTQGELLWVIDEDGKARRRGVESGVRIADQIEILHGLSPGERVVVRGFLGLSQGKGVEIVAGVSAGSPGD